MVVFDTELEVTVRILKYDTQDNFIYEEIESIQRSGNDRINFSILINTKQKKTIQSDCIEILFIHICDDDAPLQSLRKISIGHLDLNVEEENYLPRLNGDPWPIRQTFRWNLLNVPTEGPGSYVVVVTIPSDKDPKKYKPLDCAYLSVL